mmetsp:Transcript_23509/g.55711  ORF Transcript_23509/g.55711 Transcript_23509/m.55711 type:complete len:357 (+) Transcript_23509:117-1187(+)
MAGGDASSVALFWGSAAVGFAPFICFFFQIVFPKSQLLIVSTTSAFFFLCSSLFASLLWFILDPAIGLSGPWSAIIPGVFFQFIFRCAFVALYHKVESVIDFSLEKTEEEHDRAAAAATSNGNSSNNNNNNNNSTETEHTDIQAAKRNLALNDAACGLAAGTGFGGLHALLMFGSLLASESADAGVLYQPSCPMVPSLVVSAINTFCFFFLDILWMLFTFFGMRRRLLFPRGGGFLDDINPLSRQFGSYFGNTRVGGNQALLLVLISHFAAAGFTTFNSFQHGCVISLSTLPVVVLVVAWLFWSGVSKIYMPLPHSTARLSLPASYSYGSHVGNTPMAAAAGGEEDAVERMRARDD